MIRTHVGRPAAAAVVAALTAGALISVPTAAEAQAPQPVPRVSAFTLNVEYNLSTTKAIADATRAMTLGSVGGFQEFSGPQDRAALAAAAAKRGWQTYMPKGLGATVPIVWDARRYSLVDASSVLVHAEEVGVTPARYINSVRLRDTTSGDLTGFVNTHTIASASRGAEATSPARVPRLRKHIAMLRSVIQGLSATTANVIAVGDLNVNYLADRRKQVAGFPTATLGDLVSFDMPLTGSRGATSLLDYVMSVKSPSGLAPVSSKIVYGFNSDHDAVVATYQPQGRSGTAPSASRPSAPPSKKRVVIERMVQAVRGAERGATVRMATSRFTLREMRTTLAAARNRGVKVVVKVRQRVHGTQLTVSRTGGTAHVTMVGSRPMSAAVIAKRATLRVYSAASTYRSYMRAIERLR